MKLKKMDSETSIILLIISIVFPPLFIINLILLLVQYVPRKIKQEKEEKERELYDPVIEEIKFNNKNIFISDNIKDKLLPLLNTISNSYVGEDGIMIRKFITLCMLDNIFSAKLICEFLDFLISLDETTPKELKMEEMQEAIEILNNLL